MHNSARDEEPVLVVGLLLGAVEKNQLYEIKLGRLFTIVLEK
ncbi:MULTISPECIES: hypothetical protein [unclassified Acinetobacter]|nr:MULTISPECIES: hypothetical protein [unclassified Acinetobacter]